MIILDETGVVKHYKYNDSLKTNCQNVFMILVRFSWCNYTLRYNNCYRNFITTMKK